jgi:DNA-binding NarL/FixJ family response regulator
MGAIAADTKGRILIVDDHPLFRQGLAGALRGECDLVVVGEAGNSADALELAGRVAPDIAIVDMLMPRTSGITLAAELHEHHPACKVLGLSVIDEPCLIADMLRGHACGFALKTQSIAEITDAIRQVLGGMRYLAPGISQDAVDAALTESAGSPLGNLSKREREVFELVIRGHTNDEIATALFISRRTVETHRQRVSHKLSAHSIAQLQRISAVHGAGLG